MPLIAATLLAVTLMQAGAAAPFETAGVEAPKTMKSDRHTPFVRGVRKLWSSNGWIIAVATDPFTGVVQCQMRKDKLVHDRDVSYADGALGFRHHLKVNASSILFRVDDQPAQPWTNVYRDLMAKGLTALPYRAGYANDDMLFLPAEAVTGATRVTLRPSEKVKSESFDVAGFSDALAASKLVGCKDDSYVR